MNEGNDDIRFIHIRMITSQHHTVTHLFKCVIEKNNELISQRLLKINLLLFFTFFSKACER